MDIYNANDVYCDKAAHVTFYVDLYFDEDKKAYMPYLYFTSDGTSEIRHVKDEDEEMFVYGNEDGSVTEIWARIILEAHGEEKEISSYIGIENGCYIGEDIGKWRWEISPDVTFRTVMSIRNYTPVED